MMGWRGRGAPIQLRDFFVCCPIWCLCSLRFETCVLVLLHGRYCARNWVVRATTPLPARPVSPPSALFCFRCGATLFFAQTELFLKNPSRFADVARAHVEQHARQDTSRAASEVPPAAGAASSSSRPAKPAQMGRNDEEAKRVMLCVVVLSNCGCVLVVTYKPRWFALARAACRACRQPGLVYIFSAEHPSTVG